MTFFDQIFRKYAPTYTAVVDATRARDQYGNPSHPFEQPRQPIGDFVDPNPDAGGEEELPQGDQPQVWNEHSTQMDAQVAAPSADANPFDQFDTSQAAPQAAPAQPAPSAVPVRAAPAQAVPAPTPAPTQYDLATMEASNASQEVAPEQKAAIEAFRQTLATMINSGKSKAEISVFLEQNGLHYNQVKGLDAGIANAKRGATVPVGISDKSVRPPEKKDYHAEDKGGLEAFRHGLGDGLLFGAKDEIKGGIDAAGNSIANLFGPGTGEDFNTTYARVRDAERQGLKDSEYYHPYVTAAGEITGGLATAPIGGAEVAGARTVGRLALEGAAYGGLYGFNSSDGDLVDRGVNAAKSAALGGLIGGTVGKVTNSVSAGIAANRAEPSEARTILNAADNLNASAPAGERIQPVLGHTSNGGLGSTVTAVAEPLILPGKLAGVERATRRLETNSGLARDRIANDLASATADDLNTVAANQANPNLAGSLASYEAESRQASDALYTQAAQLAGNVRLDTPRTVAAIDRKLAEWAGVPGGVAGQQALVDLRNELANGTFTVDGLRRLRTSFGDSIDSNNRTVREAANALWPRLSEDISGGLRGQGRVDAAIAYRAADRNYTTRSQNLDSIRLILGDGQHSADTVADNITRMSRSDYGQLSRAISVLPADSQSSVRGAIVDNLGRANPGKQDATGERFSLETFLTQWAHDKFSDQAKAAILPAQTVRDLNDLATLASANRALRSRGNPSRSGVTVGNIGEIGALTSGAIFNPPALTAALAAFGGGKLLASPGFARALVRASESRSIEVLSRRLSEAARRNPALSQDILGFRDAMVSGKVPDNAVTAPSLPEKTAPADPSMEPNPFDQFDQGS